MAAYQVRVALGITATILEVVKCEEKGSDVNLATYLLVDAFDSDFERANVISNDSDLAGPIRLVRTRFHRKISILHPCSPPGRGPSIELRKVSVLHFKEARLFSNAGVR